MPRKTSKSNTIYSDQLTLMDLYGDHISIIPLQDLHPPDCHPFTVNDDNQMTKLVESIKQYGVREPGIARPYPDGTGTFSAHYELLSGNRRKRACELAGLDTMPVIIRNLDDDNAVIAMVDSNLQQRETILPSERAWAYKMKMDALNHNGIKPDKSKADPRHSSEIMAEQTGESAAQIFRYIRLTELVDVLLDKVDAKQLALTPAVELSHLSYDEQHIVFDCMKKYEIKPSLSQAVQLKKMKQAGTLTAEAIDKVLSATKKPPSNEPIGVNQFREYFPASYTEKQISTIISKLLRQWKVNATI